MADDFNGERMYMAASYGGAGGGPGGNGSFTNNADDDDDYDNILLVQKKLREFLSGFRIGNIFPYRDQLKQRWGKREKFLNVNLADLQEYNPDLLSRITERPTIYIPEFERAAKAALERVIVELPQGEELPNFQILYDSDQVPQQLRNINADHVNKLIKVPGIVISASRIQNKALEISCRCNKCGARKSVTCASGFSGAQLPNQCDQGGLTINEGVTDKCPPNSFVIDPDLCTYVDQQSFKLQEAPEMVPTGEMPRSMLLSVDRHLVDKVSPGTRVSVMGVLSLFSSGGGGSAFGGSSVRSMYVKVVGISVEAEGAGRANTLFTPDEELRFVEMAKDPNIYSRIVDSIAPSISGEYTHDIKKALACQLLGGSHKKLPDGMRLRGDINVLMLGDPSTAKSQFLKFIEKVAPVGVYTSGKGSSAAGLTASVIRDKNREYYLEGGAMVLADGGICCIDEFDKMREDDRVAIHEAMEQQTISIAKAGITTVLNCRTSVLAAANPIFGRYDDMKSAAENIDLMSTILSRFDLIFIVRDIRDEDRDRCIANHVMGVHLNATSMSVNGEFGSSGMGSGLLEAHIGGSNEGGLNNQDRSTGHRQRNDDGRDLDLMTLKKFVTYCRNRCAPRLSAETKDLLSSEYVNIRKDMKERRDEMGEHTQAVPITVRQLEALVRIAESLAKMELKSEVEPVHVEEAIRLFKVSTMNAASYNTSSMMEFANEETQQQVERAEAFLKHRLQLK